MFLDSRRQVTYIILIRLLLVVMNSVSMSLMRHHFQFFIDFSSEEKKQTYHHHKKPVGFFSQRFFQPLWPRQDFQTFLGKFPTAVAGALINGLAFWGEARQLHKKNDIIRRAPFTTKWAQPPVFFVGFNNLTYRGYNPSSQFLRPFIGIIIKL